MSTRRRVKRGIVPKPHTQHLIDMPLDVLFEIFLYLEPLDLLHLSRTTKALRAFLLNRSRSSALWKNAIGNVKDFPPCPHHMSAPAYTRLAFDPVCHSCFCPCETIEWDLRMRCCPDCFPKMTISRYSIPNSARSRYRNSVDLPTAWNHYKLYDNHTVFVPLLQDVQPPSLSRLDCQVAKSRKRPQNVSKEEFLAQQKGYWTSVREHARLCRSWEYRRLEEKAAQLSFVRKERIKDIKEKLKDLGWADIISSVYHEYTFLRLPQVKKLEPLTPAEWAEIEPQLTSWVQTVERDMTWKHCIDAYITVFLDLRREFRNDTSFRVQPYSIDIVMLPAVHSMLKSCVNASMNQIDVKKKLLRSLPPAIRRWSSDAVDELEQLARKELCLSPLSKPSRLPAVIFRCKTCARGRYQRLRFDEALSHDHLYKVKCTGAHSTGDSETFSYEAYIKSFDTYPRNIRVLRVDVAVSGRIENLIKRVGQNPSRVTYDELCRSTVKVVCGLCGPQTARMNFEQAFQHCLGTHLGNKQTEVWTRASAREQNADISPHAKLSTMV